MGVALDHRIQQCLYPMSRLWGFDDFDYIERSEIIWIASEKRQVMFMSLSGDPEIVITRTRATARRLHHGREQPE